MYTVYVSLESVCCVNRLILILYKEGGTAFLGLDNIMKHMRVNYIGIVLIKIIQKFSVCERRKWMLHWKNMKIVVTVNYYKEIRLNIKFS